MYISVIFNNLGATAVQVLEYTHLARSSLMPLSIQPPPLSATDLCYHRSAFRYKNSSVCVRGDITSVCAK